MKIPVYR